jgi:hypothetical protein
LLWECLRGEKLEDIGRQVNRNNYSSVSRLIERMKTELAKDRNLGKHVEEIKGHLAAGSRAH